MKDHPHRASIGRRGYAQVDLRGAANHEVHCESEKNHRRQHPNGSEDRPAIGAHADERERERAHSKQAGQRERDPRAMADPEDRHGPDFLRRFRSFSRAAIRQPMNLYGRRVSFLQAQVARALQGSNAAPSTPALSPSMFFTIVVRSSSLKTQRLAAAIPSV